MRNQHFHHKHDRRGQVLLLAVVLMLLIALVGAGFIAVIGASLSQSERHEDQVAVDKAAYEGIQYANDMLMNHPRGADWRPIDTAPAPLQAQNQPDDVEFARGWTFTNGFFKFKTQDPLAKSYFLLRVRPITLSANPLGFDPTNPASRYLEITSIGRTLNNTGVFKMLTAFKPIGINDYAVNITQYSSASDGFKPYVTVWGKPPAMDFDADALVRTNVPANTTIIPVSKPEVFSGDDPSTPTSDGDLILIGRDPNPSGAPLATSNVFNNTVGVRELVQVASVDITAHTITLAAGTTYAHEAGEPMVVGRFSGSVFERKVTIGRLVRAAGSSDNKILVNTLRVGFDSSGNVLKVKNGDTIFVGLNISTAKPQPTKGDMIQVTGVVDNESASPPQSSEIQFDNTTTPFTVTHEKSEPVRIYVPNVSNVNPYESQVAPAASDPRREAEWTGSIIRGPVFSNGEVRFFGNILFADVSFGSVTIPARVESARTITYDRPDDPTTMTALEGADSAGAAIGHPSATAVNSLTNVVTMTGNDPLSADGAARITGDPTQPGRWVRQQRPPLIAREGLFSSDPWVSGFYRVLRYEELTRHSDSRRPSGTPLTLGEMGYGTGIYIDNLLDVQFARTVSGTSVVFETFPSRRAKLIAQWTTGTPVADPGPDPTPTNTADDIPQWVNNGLEYVPLGVQIILRNDGIVWSPMAGFVDMNQATPPLTVHPTTGAPHVPGRPVIWIIRSIHPAQASIGQTPPRDVTGAFIPAWTTDPRTGSTLYFTSFDYPENGVILAAGNVRIKGNLPPSYPNTTTPNVLTGNINVVNGVPDRDYNLTVVSGGTIYIEGNILTPKDVLNSDSTTTNDVDDVHNTHIALLAKDHVCLNTTQFYAPFAVGGVPSGALPMLSFTPAEIANQPQQKYSNPAANRQINPYWDLAAGSSTTLLRQFSLGERYGGLLSIALRHGGQKKPGLRVNTTADGPATAPIVLTNPLNPAPPDPASPQQPDYYKPTQLLLNGDPTIDLKFNNAYRRIGEPDVNSPPAPPDDAEDLVSKILAIKVVDSNNNMVDKYGANAGAGQNNTLADALVRLGRSESVTAEINRNDFFEVPLVTQAFVSLNGANIPPSVGNANDPIIGNLVDPFAWFETFYQNPLNRTTSGEPEIQPLVSQSISSSTFPINNAAVGALNELRFSPGGFSNLANYRLSQFKMEQYLSGPDPLNSSVTVYRPTWGLTVKVNALIYAQEGSWFVIPGPYFDDSASNDDTRPGRGNAVRYRHYNYRVIINGAIVQNQTADDFPVTVGNKNVYTFNAGKWEERIAYPALTDANGFPFPPPPGVTPTPPFRPPYVWQGIEYNWDPEFKNFRWAVEDIASGNLKPVLQLPKLPMGPDLIFVG